MRNCIPTPAVGRKLSIRSSVLSPDAGPSGEMADAADSKSAGVQAPCRFDSDLGHHQTQTNNRRSGRFDSDLGHQERRAGVPPAAGARPARPLQCRRAGRPATAAGTAALLFLLIATAVAAGERHYIIQSDHVLAPADLADFAARGIEVQRVLPDHRYLIRAESAGVLEGDARLRSVETYSPARKVAASAYREAARAHAFATLRVRFHDDVAFEDAQDAIEHAGGTLERLLSVGFELPHGLVARIPSAAVTQLAKDERIFGIYGPPLRIRNENAVAAQLSHVTPLFSAPYNLTGNGVVLSLFELANADTSHPEFGGRLTSPLS